MLTPRQAVIRQNFVFFLLATFGVLLFHTLATCAVTGFSETFSGQGEFNSTVGSFSGLDNPDWRIKSDDGEITDDGFRFTNSPNAVQGEEIDRLILPLIGEGSFVERIVIRDLELGDIPSDFPNDSSGSFNLIHDLGGGRSEKVGLKVGEDFRAEPGHWLLIARAGDTSDLFNVPRSVGGDIEVGIRYDHARKEVIVTYDEDMHDAKAAHEFGPFNYEGQFSDAEHFTEVFIGASHFGIASGTIALWTLTPFSHLPGDFNGNDVLDVNDIDLLSTETRAGTHDTFFDLNDDSLVNDTDRTVWVHDLKQTSFGDANLNGLFDSADLVNVFRAGEYDDDIELNSTWATGDWNGDGEFDSGDFVTAFQDGGYVQGAAASVPEPSTLILMLIGALMLVRFRTRKWSHSCDHF